MWLRKILTVGIVALLVSTTLSPNLIAVADSAATFTEYDRSWLPSDINDVTTDTTRYIVDDAFVEGGLSGGGSNLSTQTKNPLPTNPNNFDQLHCASYQDKNCASLDISFFSFLPVCKAINSPECIVSLRVGPNGNDEELQFKKYLDFQGPIDLTMLGKNSWGTENLALHRINDFESDPSRDLPPGSRVSLWQSKTAPENSKSYYAIAVMMKGTASVGKKAEIESFQISVIPVIEKTADHPFAPTLVSVRDVDGHVGVGGIGGSWWSNSCLYRLYGTCYVRAEFPENIVMTLTANLSSSVTGWLHGRIGKPSIDIKSIGERTNQVTISGEPAKIPMETQDFESSSLPKDLRSDRPDWYQTKDKWLGTWNLFADGSFRFDWFEKLLPFLDDQADAATSVWSLRSVVPRDLHPCLKSSTQLMGLVTTNAMMYSGEAPKFDNGFLSYRVAGLHKGPKDEIWRGTYDLVMRSESARCLYKFSTAPVSATIQVVNSGGENQVSTTSLTEKNGWLRLGAYNFTFSSPTIKVKLTQKGQATSAAGSGAKMATIKCVKGSQVKSVTAKKPVCPKGYKKK